MEGVKSQGWEEFFDRLKGPFCTELVNSFWIFVTTSNLQITSFVLGHKIIIFEKSIVKLLNHDGYGKRCFDMLAMKDKLDDISRVIFQDGKNSSNAKNLHKHLRVGSRFFWVIFTTDPQQTQLTTST